MGYFYVISLILLAAPLSLRAKPSDVQSKIKVTDVFVHSTGLIIADLTFEFLVKVNGAVDTREERRLYYGNPKKGVLHEVWDRKLFHKRRINIERSSDGFSSKRFAQTSDETSLLLFTHDIYEKAVEARISVTVTENDDQISTKGRLNITCNNLKQCFERDQEQTDQLQTIIAAKEILLQELPYYRVIDHVFQVRKTDRYYIVDFDVYAGRTNSIEVLEFDGTELKSLPVTDYLYDAAKGTIDIRLTPEATIHVRRSFWGGIKSRLIVADQSTNLRTLSASEINEGFLKKIGLSQARYANPSNPSPCDLL